MAETRVVIHQPSARGSVEGRSLCRMQCVSQLAMQPYGVWQMSYLFLQLCGCFRGVGQTEIRKVQQFEFRVTYVL